MTLKPIVNEIRIQNQVTSLDPPIEYAHSTWIHQLHDWLGIVCRLQRIQSSRYEIGLQMQGATVVETLYISLLTHPRETDLEAEYVFDRLGKDLARWQQLLTEIKKVHFMFNTSKTQKLFGVGMIDVQHRTQRTETQAKGKGKQKLHSSRMTESWRKGTARLLKRRREHPSLLFCVREI
ncbi:hypothetical protein PILCRDRAFT_10293 [Piloderma croceum F 1598]|uniref:Uncharacterized protein n=1 Tax=Piloderma croceum (strain F 1598) TaxID=765440 RepID=A0A0C3AZN4_PILCF|nr:hypothetical protein PILCRDRAFT_10293 [Piloderma croceum F 1598]